MNPQIQGVRLDNRIALFEAGKLLKKYDFKDQLRSYCLIGYRGDTFQKAEKRLRECYQAGFLPMAMLYVR